MSDLLTRILQSGKDIFAGDSIELHVQEIQYDSNVIPPDLEARIEVSYAFYIAAPQLLKETK